MINDPTPYYRKLTQCIDHLENWMAQHAARHVPLTNDEVSVVAIARHCVEALEGDPGARAALLVIGAIDPAGAVVCNECGEPLRSNPQHDPPLHCPRCS